MKFRVGDRVRVKKDNNLGITEGKILSASLLVTDKEDKEFKYVNGYGGQTWVNLLIKNDEEPICLPENDLELDVSYINEQKLKAKLFL